MSLTGEWLPAEKNNKVLDKKTALADRDNMVYMGTTVQDGKARVVVIATGQKTEIGKVASMIKEAKTEKTPYQKRLSRFAFVVGIVIGFICLLIFIIGVALNQSFFEMFIVSVAVAVAAIPEGLPVAMTVILALGMQRILKKKGLVRKLSSAETLGSTNIICSDKTATITEGKMRVSQIIPAGKILGREAGQKVRFLGAKISALSNESFIENPESPIDEWIIRGRPTDKALLLSSIKEGVNKVRLEKELKLVKEFPFDSLHKYIASVFKDKNKNYLLYVSGAPEKIIEKSSFINLEKKDEKLIKNDIKILERGLDKMAAKGMRVISTAFKVLNDKEVKDIQKEGALEKIVKDLSLNCFFGIKDPVRSEVKDAIRVCKRAGMKPIIVTGDHKLTAKAVAEEIGIKAREENVLTGIELDELSDEDFMEKIEKIQIYARMEPKHKIRIVEMWQRKNNVVAMTGDGINDAPALKKADIGVSIGSGTEVAKEASNLILLNDSFSIIVSAVEEGRAIIDNIRKVITYLLSDSFTEVILVLGSVLTGSPLAISASQILWVNLIEDGLPNMSLSFEPKEKNLMENPPQEKDAPLLNKEMKAIIFIIGFLTDFILLGLFFWLWNRNHDIYYVRTMVFACLAIDSLFYVFSCKSLKRNLWHINPFSNKFLLVAVLFGVVMLFLAVYLPFFQNLLETVPLRINDWIIIFYIGFLELIFVEIAKWHFIVRHHV
jgi:Ca2+-transporting ATPase